LRCGLPGATKPWTFYEVWEVDRIDRYIRVEAIVGVPIPPVEAAARR